MELDRFTGRFPHTRHTPETSEIVTSPHQMATDYVWLKTQIRLIPSGIPALARIWLKTRLDSKSSESNLVRVRVPPLVLSKTRGFWQGAESPFFVARSHTLSARSQAEVSIFEAQVHFLRTCCGKSYPKLPCRLNWSN